MNPGLLDWGNGQILAGNAMLLLAAILWALGSCLYRRFSWHSPFWVQTFWQLAVSIVPVDKMSDKAPDHRVYAGQRHEIGAGWSQVAKSSGETYLNLKIGAPEFGPNWVRCRLVKLEQPAEDGATHIALWEPRDQ